MLQHNDNVYGEYLHVAEVETFNRNGLQEKEIDAIKCQDIITDRTERFTRIHTYNRAGNYEVVDLLYDMIIPERFFPSMFRYLKKRIARNRGTK